MIKWTDIEMECGDYRAGFVATFRKYEGQPTDEKDEQGRTVKVTVASFARHIGVHKDTFMGWVRKLETGTSSPAPRNRPKEIMRHTVRMNPEAVVEAIDDLPEEQAADIIRQLHVKRLDRVRGHVIEPTNKADRKAIRAEVREAFEPLHRSLDALKAIGVADAIRECADDLRKARPDEEELAEIDAALDDLRVARMELALRLEQEQS